MGHGISSKTRPQSASPGESSQLPCFCSTILFGHEAGSEFGISLTTRQRVGLFYHSDNYIENMSAGKPTAILYWLCSNFIRKITKPSSASFGQLINGELKQNDN